MKRMFHSSMLCAVIILIAVGFVCSASAIAGNSADKTKVIDAVNINIASVKELVRLPGIGRKKAEAIIAYREKNGDFQHIEEVKRIEGIGDKIFDRIRDLIIIK